MSARDQLARLKSGVTKAAEFDWQAMAFDFGPKGRAALSVLAKSGTEFQRTSAKAALASDNRWDVENQVKIERADGINANFSFQPADRPMDIEARRALIRDGQCRQPCRILWLTDSRIVVVGGQYQDGALTATIYALMPDQDAETGGPRNFRWQRENRYAREEEGLTAMPAQANIEIRDVPMSRVYVDGKPVGEVFTK
jgi:hypothetical protein